MYEGTIKDKDTNHFIGVDAFLQKKRKKILTDNSGGDHHSNIVAEALSVKLRVPDDFGNLSRLPVIVKFDIWSLSN